MTKARSNATAPGAKGDLVVGSGSNASSLLTVGTDGLALIADSTQSTGIKWGAISQKVLQVVSASTSTAVSGSGTSYFDSGLSASITPTASTSKILVLVQQHMYVGRGSSQYDVWAFHQLLRNSTVIDRTLIGMFQNTNWSGYGGFAYLDSPSTTSSTTYKTQGNGSSTNTSVQYQWTFGDTTYSSIVLLEIGA